MGRPCTPSIIFNWRINYSWWTKSNALERSRNMLNTYMFLSLQSIKNGFIRLNNPSIVDVFFIMPYCVSRSVFIIYQKITFFLSTTALNKTNNYYILCGGNILKCLLVTNLTSNIPFPHPRSTMLSSFDTELELLSHLKHL